jgi:hypothetical protein
MAIQEHGTAAGLDEAASDGPGLETPELTAGPDQTAAPDPGLPEAAGLEQTGAAVLDPPTAELESPGVSALDLPDEAELALAGEANRWAALHSWRRRFQLVVAWTDRPIVTGLTVLLAATGFAVARWDMWSRRTIGRFILIGQDFAHPAQLPAGMPLRAATGYDGQFYYRLAINPLNLHQTAYGVSIDSPYRFMRIGYPILTWLLSFGQTSLVPLMLVVVNAAAIGVIGYIGGRFAIQGGRHAAWGLLLPGYFGLVTSLCRDTAEPVAAACMVAGLLAIRLRQRRLAALVLAFGVLTRETVMVLVAAIAIVRITGFLRRRDRPGRDDVVWVLPAAAFVVWELLVLLFAGTLPVLADGGRNAGTPFVAPIEALKSNLAHIDWHSYNAIDVWLAEVAVLLIFAVAALCSLRVSRALAHEKLALVLFLVEICVVTPSTWGSVTADLRSFVEVYLMAVVVLLGRPRRSVSRLGAWLLPALTLGLLPVLDGVIRLRLHWA